jgi:hypothetical protein
MYRISTCRRHSAHDVRLGPRGRGMIRLAVALAVGVAVSRVDFDFRRVALGREDTQFSARRVAGSKGSSRGQYAESIWREINALGSGDPE